ncbi:hypothetical protein [Paenibacillus alvei]|uniref:Uncharacterized protein n=1 Tax=Paenibacillus alvei TaxID=44250 RepID=A0A383RC80_PAEAL|nr:hypothetical protein [Paenibacillus alvei]SYX84707.1 conserved protein of unknown function [Paenibacillus alvei]
MSENHPHPLFRGFSRKQEPDLHSPALDALRSLRENSSKKDTHREQQDSNHAISDEQLLHLAENISTSDEDMDDRSLPSRKKLFPSSYVRLTKWFYNFLFLLFVGLLIGLLFWGRHKLGLEG